MMSNDMTASRRSILLGGLATLTTAGSGLAQSQAEGNYRIDTHHHIFPPKYLAEVRERIIAQAQGLPTNTMMDWTPQRSLDEMERSQVAKAVVSVAAPGIYFGDVDQGRRLARACVDFGAEMIQKNPGRFGMFAPIPLPDVEGSLNAIAYALDELKLDGIGILTSYGNRWPGDAAFAPVFEELNRRKAKVFVHPLAPDCCSNLQEGVSSALIEFPTDTTRCITSLLFSGTLTRCPDIEFIFAQGGGTIPFLAGRLNAAMSFVPDLPKKLPKGILYELKRLNYDIVSMANPISIAALLQLVPTKQLFFGSDFPYLSGRIVADGLKNINLLSPVDLDKIERENAIRILARA
jgi:predicted TIM-barrel fold metal-dependent hydrolase